jgi:hypothetical protein
LVSEKKPNILIAVPTTGGQMKSRTAESLAQLMKVLTKNGIDADLRNINNSDIVTVRNQYANSLLNSDKWDSLLFIDSDMAFTPRVVLRMIKLNAPVSAAACTKRHIDLEKFANGIREHGDMERARAEASFFNTLITWDNSKKTIVQMKDGFYSMAAVGMAMCLIQKSALEAMIEEGAVEQRQDVYEGVKRTSWAFFDFVKYHDLTLTEDYSFCHRWTHMMKRPLWVCADEIVEHIGDFPYWGRYSTMLQKLLQPGSSEEAKPAPVASA